MPSTTNTTNTTNTTTTNWSSEGYDTDALGDDLTSVLEIGGGSSKVPVPTTDTTATAADTTDTADTDTAAAAKKEQEEDDPLQESEQLKAQGNAAFSNQEWLEAVDRYTDAIAACPPDPYTGAELVQQQHEWQEAENVRLRRELNNEDARQREKKQAETNASKKKEKKKAEAKAEATSKTPSNAEPDADAPKAEEEDEDEDPNKTKAQDQKEPQAPPPPPPGRREFAPAEVHPHATQLAVYHCNRAAAHLHLQQYESAVTDTTIAILLNPLYVKAYVRRSAAYERTDRTDQALTDAKQALELSTPTPSPSSSVSSSSRSVSSSPALLNIRQTVARLQKLEDVRLEQLKSETMDKLKDLGNSILGNFGLSMDNFNAKQDPNTGSYSISFDQGGGK